MSASKLTLMQQGKRRALRERESESVARVRSYERWLHAGSKLKSIPAIPTDADYAVARRRGVVR